MYKLEVAMKERLRLISLTLAITICVGAQAQTPKADSLREVLKRDTANFDVLMQLAQLLVDTDDLQSIAYAKQAKSIGLSQGDSTKIVYASRFVGQLYNRLSDINMAINELAPLLAVAERNGLRNETKKIYNSLAISFNNLGEFDKALDYHLKSLRLKEEDKDSSGIAVSLNNIGLVYYRISNFNRALQYWRRCLALKLAINDNYDLDALYLNLGLCFKQLGDLKESKVNLERVLAACAKGCTNRILIHSQCALGELKFKEHKLIEAKTHLNKSLALSRQEGNLEYELESLLTLAEVYVAEHDPITVKKYLKEISILEGKEQFVSSLQRFYRISSDYYFRNGSFRIANEFERKYSQLNESINSSEMHRRLMELQLNFVERENAEKLRYHQTLLASQSELIEKQYLINSLLFGLAILALGLVFVFFKLNIKKEAINRRLDELVRERTLELEMNRNELFQLSQEQKIVLDRISSNLIASLATIQGLNHVAALENLASSSPYLEATEAILLKSIETIRANGSFKNSDC